MQVTLDSLHSVFQSASAIKSWLAACANRISRGDKNPGYHQIEVAALSTLLLPSPTQYMAARLQIREV